MNELELFAAAVEITDPTERAALMDRECAGDPAKRVRLEALLRAHDRPDSLLDRPAVAPRDPDTATTRTIGHEGSPAAVDEVPLGFLAPPTRPDSLGRIGHYEVLQVLGQGGFGIVFRAFDDVLQRVVAVKVLAPQLAATSPARKRFLREARTSAAVRHENVVQVYEVGETPLPYIAMEFIPGETLQQRLDRIGPVEPAEVVRIGRQIAEGLAAAHANDLIHRDIKPANVLLEGGQQRVKITDFGLARAADDASISQSGIIAGTPMYMAPEQAKGERLDQRADLFSLGSVLYQMATGRAPFRANSTVAVLKRVAEDTPRDIREIIPETPQWLCDIIAKLHAKNPDDRYQSAREVADVLADCEAQLKTHAKLKDFSLIPEGKPEAGPESPGIERWKWVAAAVAGMLMLSVVIYTLLHTTGGGDTALVQKPVSPAPDADGWVQLFNGKDLTGWKPHADQPGDWRVEDGVLVGRGPRKSHLFTDRGDYADFHLRVEAKLEPGGNSGVCFRSEFKLAPFGGVPDLWLPPGYEADINDTPKQEAKTGSLWRTDGGELVVVKETLVPPDTWFRLEVIAVGPRITVKVNGRTTADWMDERADHRTGHIALQVNWPETTVVRFRKIEVKELPASSPVAPALAVAPFDAAEAKGHQEAWAKHLGVPAKFENSIGMKLKLIPPGKFTMGIAREEIDRIAPNLPEAWQKQTVALEVPTRNVTIDAPFYLGECEVPVSAFREFVKATKYRTTAETNGKGGRIYVGDGKIEFRKDYTWKHPDLTTSEDLPVVEISLKDAEAFCEWLSKKEGRQYVVPNEQQWEYACRAGTTTRWWNGDDEDNVNLIAWTSTNTINIQPVGRKPGNPFGLRDMHGNVEEVCRIPGGGAVARSGPHGSPPLLCRSACRFPVPDDEVWAARGFRVAVVGDLKRKAPPAAVVPFDAAEAKEHQEAWAKHLDVSVEDTNSIGMKLRLIPPGEFTMGSSKEEIEWLLENVAEYKTAPDWLKDSVRDEGPARRVTLREPFYLGTWEVTVGQFREFVKAKGYKTDAEREGGGLVWSVAKKGWEQKPEYVWNNPTLSKSDSHPVFQVTLADARAFCAWLSEKEGRRYAVPTEEQWEYAYRAGTTTRWPFGDDPESVKKYGWVTFNSDGIPRPVGRLAANPFGLFDMCGNAAEITTDAQGRMVDRGGSAGDSVWWSRSAKREVKAEKPWNGASAGRGFRVAIVGDLKPKPPAADKDRLRGVWVGESGERDGTPLPAGEVAQIRLRLDIGRLVLTTAGGKIVKGTLKFDPGASPKEIDVVEDDDRKAWSGIYRFLPDDRLEICMGEEKERPKEFKSAAGTTRMGIVLKRAAEPAPTVPAKDGKP
jgi:uncharacterized protein (TIGR03067 family)